MNEALTILIIDDNEDDRTLYQRSLKEVVVNNFRFVETASGESGLKELENDTPHCVLLDYSLPGHNGIEVLKRIRAKHPHLPVIMLTSQGSETIAVQSMKEGAHDYIAKGAITPEALQRVVRTAIEHAALQKNIHEQRTSLEIFTRALAHDLKEPLRTIRSLLEQITDWRSLNEQSQQSFQHISKAADRMNALIDTVYLYTRLDAAEQMEKSSCDMSGILEEVQENLARLIEERGAIITHSALPQVHTNRVQMIQLFQNLLANSIRHCEVPVTTHVSAKEHDDYWRFTVHDNGPGMAMGQLEKIFDPFKRLSHRKEDGQGFGLGLAISRKIVESHGGKIWCESKPGIGTSFLFTLPKVTVPTTAESGVFARIASLKPQAAGMTSTLGRVLLVDDNNLDIQWTRMALDRIKFRCEILTARDGQEALITLRKAAKENNPIDLLLLDVNMPVMGGFELLVEMRKEHMFSDTLAVMCSTSASDIDRRMAESLGATGYLVKPPQLPLLTDMIDQSAHLQMHHEGDDHVLRRAV